MRPLLLLLILSVVSAGCLGSDDAGDGLDAAGADVAADDAGDGAPDPAAGAAGDVAEDGTTAVRDPVTESFALTAGLHVAPVAGQQVSDMREVAKVVAVPDGAVAVRVEVHWTPVTPLAEQLHGMVHDTTDEATMLVGMAGPSPITMDITALGNLTELNVMAHGTGEQPAVMVNQEVHYAVTYFFGALDPSFSAFSDA